MTDERSRRERPPRFDRHLVLGGTLSAVMHAVAIVLLLVAPARFQSGPPTAYTVEVVDPDALGGGLLAGPIGGGEQRRAPKPAPPPPPPANPEPPPEPPPEADEPEKIAKAEPPEADEGEVVAVATARPTPKRTPPPKATAALKPTAAPAKPTAAAPKPTAPPKPAATRVAVVRAASPIAKASPVRAARVLDAPAVPVPAKTQRAETGTDAEGGAEGADDLDTRLSAAIKGVETKVGRGSGAGPAGESGGGMGGTDERMEGPAGVGGSGPGGGGQVRGLEFVSYYGRMLNRIKERWTWLGERSDLRVTVRFSILPSGDIANLRLMERSGDGSYDASVERAVKAASPFSPPPEAYLRDFSDVELMFRPADLRSSN